MIEEHTLSSIEIEPTVPAQKSIIWLHGLGADGSDFVPIVPELQLPESLGIRFIFPHAPIRPVTINNGYRMRAWYDITAFSMDGISDKTGIADSVTAIRKLIEKEEARGITSPNIILAGFSQGAAIALTTALCYPKPLAGIIVLSGYLPLAEQTLREASEANRSIPIFLAHGMQDPIVPYALGKAVYVALKQAGYTASWHSYPTQHSVCAEEIHDISMWLKNNITRSNHV